MQRADWVEPRKSDKIRTQMHYARQGTVTEEMAYVARRETLPPALVRDEVAARPDDHPSQYQPFEPGADGHRRGFEM